MADNGQPLHNASVRVVAVGATGAAPRATSTNAEGKFEMQGLAAGAYTVMADAPGYVPTYNPISGGVELPLYRLGDSVTITLIKGGVISGTVTNANGEPVVAVPVRAVRVRDANNRPARSSGFMRDGLTDDRGAYRMYGLGPGAYIVAAGGNSRFYPEASAYDGDAPTYYPTTAREAATEVTVQSGVETTGIDIRYRGEPGHVISGTVIGGSSSTPGYTNVTLTNWKSGAVEAATYLQQNNDGGFALHGVPDGEYNLTASRYNNSSGENIASPDRRVVVKGADVSGMEIRLAPLGSIAGRIALEAKPPSSGASSTQPCDSSRSAALEESVITLRLDEKEEDAGRLMLPNAVRSSTPKETGEFTINNLKPGRYRIGMRLPIENWYVQSISMREAATGKAQAVDPAKNLIDVALKSGERASGLIVTVADGAARISGRVAPETEGAALPARLRVYLVPAEPEQAGNPLRYMEAAVDNSNTFVISNIAPGRYWLLARTTSESNGTESFVRPVAWDADERARLRREAERANTIVELPSCKRVADYVLRYNRLTVPTTNTVSNKPQL